MDFKELEAAQLLLKREIQTEINEKEMMSKQ